MNKHFYGLYDAGNSSFQMIVITFIIGPYLINEVSNNAQQATVFWYLTSGMLALVVGLIGPFIGNLADTKIRNGRFVIFYATTIFCCFCMSLFWFIKPDHNYFFTGLFIFFIGAIFYELSFMFYNSFLFELGSNKTLGYYSGIGYAWGYFGAVPVFIFSLIFFILPDQTLFNLNKFEFEHKRILPVLGAVYFFMLSMPFIQKLKERKFKKFKAINIFQFIKKVLIQKKKFTELSKLLIIRIFYTDAITIVSLGLGIYATIVHNYNVKELIVLVIFGNIVACIGSVVGGYINDKWGSKKTLFWSIVIAMVAMFCVILSENKNQFLYSVLLLSTIVGPMQSSTRVLMSRFTQHDRPGIKFGLYTFSGRATSFLGPLLASVFAVMFGAKYSLFATLPLFGVALFLITKLKVKKKL